MIGELEAAVATYPFQEGLWELLITALYRAGRQADALATYQRVRNRLADELGLDPGPPLQQLEQQILTQDASLGVARPPGRPHRHPVRRAGTCRRCRSSWSVATAEVDALSDLLASSGSSRSSGREVSGRRRSRSRSAAGSMSTGRVGSGGVWLARLETAATPNDVIDTVIAALNVPGGEEALFERLKGTAAVVILDNCEHVLDAAAALAVRLLDAAPGCGSCAPARCRLDVDGEAVFELAPLALSDAVELFTRRATHNA